MTYESHEQYNTVSITPGGTIKIRPTWMIKFDNGFNEDSLIITSTRYYPFMLLLEKSCKLISDNFLDLFPNIGRIEFEIDSKVLDTYQTEKAISTVGMSIIPAVYVDKEGVCAPGMRIMSDKSSIIIPFEDALPIPNLLKSLDPNNLMLNLLNHVKE